MKGEDLLLVGAVGFAALVGYMYFTGSGGQQNPESGDLLAGGAGVVLAALLFL